MDKEEGDKRSGMIEETEIFEYTSDTSYRVVCPQKDTVRGQRTFSSHWDPNESDCIYNCVQNGSFQRINVKTHEWKCYNILFRRFKTSYSGMSDDSDGKVVNHHFDKMSLIPGRPGEFFFLLGISQTLMYSSIPGAPGLIARASRDDLPHFVYGAPVLEFYKHSARITSITTSMQGNLLATGDESGHVRISLIQNYPEPGDRSTKNFKKVGKVTLPSNCFLTFPAHDSSVYALEFLAYELEEQRAKSENDQATKSVAKFESTIIDHYTSREKKLVDFEHLSFLVTGSDDRAVRIWKIKYSKKDGAMVYPFLNLDTLRTHVLCLNSIVGGVKPPPVLDELVAWTVANEGMVTDTLQNTSSNGLDDTFRSEEFISPKKRRSVIEKETEKEFDGSDPSDGDTEGKATVFLSAGTNVGAVYIWKLDMKALCSQYSVSANESLRDDGNNLACLQHTSDRPIVQVSMGTTFDSDSHEANLVMVASDTSGTVRAHCEVPPVPMDGSVPGDMGQEKDRLHLAIVGEMSFPYPVVASTFPVHIFRRPPVWVPRDEMPKLRTRSMTNTSVSDGSSIGSSSCTNATLIAMENMYEHVLKSLKDIKDEMELHEQQKTLLLVCCDGQRHLFRASSFLHLAHQGREQRGDQGDTDDFNEKKINDDSSTEEEEDEEEEDTEGVRVKEERRREGRGGKQEGEDEHNSYRSAHDSDSRGSGSCKYSADRGMSSSRTTAMAPHTDIQRQTSSGVQAPATHTNRDVPNYSETSVSSGEEDDSEGERKEGAQRAEHVLASTRTLVEPRSASRIPTPYALANEAMPPSAQAWVSRIEPVKSPGLKPANPAEGGDNDNHSDSDEDTINAPVKLTDSQKLELMLSKVPTGPSPESELAVPQAFSSKAVEEKVTVLARKLDEDEISVSTMETTNTERRAIANRVSNLSPRKAIYKDLPKLDDSAIKRKTVGLPKISKQIDPKWRAMKDGLRPALADLDILYTKHPQVDLVLKPRDNAAGSSSSSSTNGTAGGGISGRGLVYSINPNTLLPDYQIEVEADSIYGELGALAGPGDTESAWENNDWETSVTGRLEVIDMMD
jgi:WD40 repeat protein